MARFFLWQHKYNLWAFLSPQDRYRFLEMGLFENREVQQDVKAKFLHEFREEGKRVADAE